MIELKKYYKKLMNNNNNHNKKSINFDTETESTKDSSDSKNLSLCAIK